MNSGIRHIDVGPELTRSEWESQETHELLHGTAFPTPAVERQLFYRDDLHEWYIYDGTAWVSLQGAGSLTIHDNAYHSPNFEEEGVAATQIGAHAAIADAHHGRYTDGEAEAVANAQIATHAANADAHKGQKNSIENDGGDLQLVNDQAAPGNDKVYGTGPTGVKGWKDDPAGPGGGMTVHDNTYHDPNYATQANFNTHAARHESGGMDEILVGGLTGELADDQPPKVHGHAKHDPLTLIDAVRAANFIMIPTAAGWTTSLTGAGNVRQEPMRNLVEITDTNAGSALAHAAAFGFNIGGAYGRMNWSKRFMFIFNYAIFRSAAGLNRRIQVKQATALGDLAQVGIGIKAVDLVLTGEAYGVSRGTVSLGNLVHFDGFNYEMIQVAIEIDPVTPAVNFYINGSLGGSITNPDHVPSGLGTTGTYLVHSIDRAGSGDSGVASVFLQGKMWGSFQGGA